MKFRCERDALVEGLSTAQRAAAKRAGALPVLSGLKITAQGDTIELVGSDLELTNRVSVPAAIDEPGVAVVQAKVLAEIVKAMEPGAVELTVEGEAAHVTGGRARFDLRLLAADDYPRLVSTAEEGISIRAGAFTEAIGQVVPAASNDDLRPILTGVLLAAHGGGLRLVATDSYRLAVRDLPGEQVLPEGKKLLVAGAGLREVERLAAGMGADDALEVVLGDRDVVFRTPRGEVTVRLIEGEFPNYEQLIHRDYPNRLTIAKDAFVESVRRVSLVGQGQDNVAVRLAMHSDGVDLSVTSQEIGSAQEAVDAKFEGTELTVSFNPRFLLEGVQAVAGSEVVLETIDPLKPTTLHGADQQDFLYLLMPVRTS